MLASNQMMQAPETSGSGLDLGQVLKRRKLLLLLGLIVGTSLGYLYYIRQPPVYQSTAKVMLQQKKSENMPVKTAGFVYKSNLANELEVIKSESLIAQAIKKGQLDRLDTFKSGNVAEILSNNLRVAQEEEADVLVIGYRGAKGQDCREVVTAITEAYKSHLAQQKKNADLEIKTIIEDAKNGVLDELKAEEKRHADLVKSSDYSVLSEVNIKGERLSRMQQQITEAEFRIQSLISEISTIEKALKQNGRQAALALIASRSGSARRDIVQAMTNQQTPQSTTPTIAKPMNLSTVDSQIIATELDLEAKRRLLGAKHPDIQELQTRLAKFREYRLELVKQAEDAALAAANSVVPVEIVTEEVDIVAEYLSGLQLDLQMTNQNKSVAEKNFKAEATRAKEIQFARITIENLNRSIREKRELRDEFIRRFKNMEQVHAYEGRTANILDQASIAEQVGPPFYKIMTLGSVIGLISGFALACLIELADKSFRGPEDLMAELSIPVLSHIPFMREAKKSKGPDPSGVDSALITVLRPKSRTAEAYRSVRTALYFSTSGENHKIVQVTSPVAGDGKSTLAANLAVAIAHSGKKVLLVDADLRRPTVHKVFSLSNTEGVSTIVSGSTSLTAAIHDVPIENLQVLPCGLRPDNPSEMLLSPEFDQLLQHVRSIYDFVVIDSPPILAVTDPASIAARADGVIVTLRLAKRSRDLARRAVEQLQNVGANILGVVVNGVDSVESYGYRSQSYGGYGYAGYGQSYGGYYATQNGAYYEEDRKSKVPAPKLTGPLAERAENGNGR